MTLYDWFIKNTKTPLTVLGSFVILIYLFFAYYAIRINQEHQYSNFRDLIVTSVNIGIQQNNRELIESSLSRSVDTLGAKSAYFCQNGVVLVGTKVNAQNCEDIALSGPFDRLLKFNISGFSEYQLYVIAPKYNFQSGYFWILIATFLVLLASAWIIAHIRRKFIDDILAPMENNLLTDGNIGIFEFQRLRDKINELSASKETEAFQNAVNESKKAFSHNVKSPLRNLKLIRERFKNSFNEDDKELFDSAISQISSMADKLRIRGYKKNQEAKNASQIAIVDIEEILNQSIRKKTHEWSGDQSPIEIRLKSDVSTNSAVAIESNEMRSLLSNLLNNAFEAKASCVELSLRSSGEQFILDIIDNGRGVVDSIREKLFNEGATAGKPNGTGFGLYHAKKYLKLWNGDIGLISSRAGNTHFRITLPIWKIPQIAITATDTIVVLDDKPVEINRLKKSISLSGVKNRVVSFTSSIDFLTWYKKHSQPSIALLADYDLGEKSPTGIELIQSLGLKNRSVLVTDNYEDERLYAQCLSLGVLLAPKNNVERLSFFSI